MSFREDFWPLVGFIVTVLSAFGGIGFALMRQIQSGLDERFQVQEKTREANHDQVTRNHEQITRRLDGIEQVNREETLQWQRVEREMLRFQADLPMKYVMRDDYIRGQTLIEAKLDGLADKIDNRSLRAQLNGER